MIKKTGFWIIPFILIIGACANRKNMVNYKPIGYFSTEYTTKTGAPRQGILKPESKGIIILNKEYRNLVWQKINTLLDAI